MTKGNYANGKSNFKRRNRKSAYGSAVGEEESVSSKSDFGERTTNGQGIRSLRWHVNPGRFRTL